MGKFDHVLENLRYAAKCRRSSVVLGDKGIFGATKEEADKDRPILAEYEEAIRILEEHDG